VVESQIGYDVVIVYGRPVNHVLHVLLTLFCTCGLWVIPWFLITVFGGQKRCVLTVDAWGHVQLS